MTTIDPYPEDLAGLDDPSSHSRILSVTEVQGADPLAQAVNRLAQAVEQLVLATLDSPKAAASTSTLAALPPVASGVPDVTFDGCPIHHQPWKVVPAGISKKTGRQYSAFKACPVAGCDQRPHL